MAEQMQWQHRIVGYGFEDPAQLLANEANWRIHPFLQQQVIEGVLDTVGWVDNVMINKRTSELWGPDRGVEVVLDGHMRVASAISKGEKKVPTKYVDLTPDEEALVLATFDPIAALAVTDPHKLNELVKQIDVENDAVMRFAAELTTDIPVHLPPEDFGSYGEDIETAYCCPKCGYKWSGKPS